MCSGEGCGARFLAHRGADAGRWVEPEDLQGAIVFLASSSSDYVNGTILTVDGGWIGR
ncbi:MAG: SDR family oxidoreductase [Terriglobia bacterium]